MPGSKSEFIQCCRSSRPEVCSAHLPVESIGDEVGLLREPWEFVLHLSRWLVLTQIAKEEHVRNKILAFVTLLISASLFAHDHPWPAPTATISVTDISVRTSPVVCLGSASVYVDRKLDGTVSSWVEPHPTVKNVSSKVITKMVLEVQWQDVHGEGNSLIHYELDFTDPTDSIQPGSSWTSTVEHMPTVKIIHKAAEFDSLPSVAPKVRIHALSITFSDGSTYTEAADDKERPW